MLEQEFEYYRANQADLVSKYRGKVVVIRGHEVVGVYDSELAALNEAGKAYEVGTFLVQRVEPGTEGFTQVFHSRVAFG